MKQQKSNQMLFLAFPAKMLLFSFDQICHKEYLFPRKKAKGGFPSQH
jgi:hypothetical protein